MSVAEHYTEQLSNMTNKSVNDIKSSLRGRCNIFIKFSIYIYWLHVSINNNDIIIIYEANTLKKTEIQETI